MLLFANPVLNYVRGIIGLMVGEGEVDIWMLVVKIWGLAGGD